MWMLTPLCCTIGVQKEEPAADAQLKCSMRLFGMELRRSDGGEMQAGFALTQPNADIGKAKRPRSGQTFGITKGRPAVSSIYTCTVTADGACVDGRKTRQEE